MNIRCRRMFALLLLALVPGRPETVAGVPRWEGDNLGNGNNPPAQNAALPAGLKNSVVRVRTFFGNNLQGAMTDVIASGCLLLAKRDGADIDTGRICILTSDHNISVTPDKKFNYWQVGFGNGQFDPDIPIGLRAFHHNNPAAQIKKNGLALQMKAENGKRPDIGILGIIVNEWSVLPGTLDPPPVKAPAAVDPETGAQVPVVAGYGNTGTVDTGNRRYTEVSEYGTLRTGTNRVDQEVNHTNDMETRAGVRGEYKALEASMQFHPDAQAQPTSADAYILNKDSGGPTLQKVGNEWRLIGVHSESEPTETGGIVTEGKKLWDVRAAEYSDFIERSCKVVAEMPNYERTRPSKKRRGRSDESPASYDGGGEQLGLSVSPMGDTGYSGDPILSADVTWPPLRLLGATPTGDFAFDTDTTVRLEIAEGSATYLRARVPLLMYETRSKTFVALLRDVRLAGASPSQPFYDPTLIAPSSPWIGALRDGLDPASSMYLGGEGLWVEFTTSQDLAALTSEFTASASTSGQAVFYADGPTAGVPTAVPVASPWGLVVLALGLTSLAGLRLAVRRVRTSEPGPVGRWIR